MPTEHEFKYVLKQELADVFQNEIVKFEHEKQLIRQGYLAFSKGMTARVRAIRKPLKEEKWYFTFKQKVGNRVIEIEKKIDARDGQDLWDIAVGRLKKERYVFDNKDETWEVDFFSKGDHLYFVLMEVELEEGSVRPREVPDFIAPYMLHEVSLDDDRFSNKRLGDVEFATTIYHKLTKDNYDENHEQELRPN